MCVYFCCHFLSRRNFILDIYVYLRSIRLLQVKRFTILHSKWLLIGLCRAAVLLIKSVYIFIVLAVVSVTYVYFMQ